MTQEQLQDALGMIDDDLIESVDKLRQERDSHAMSHQLSSLQAFSSFRKKIIRREIFKWGSLAASICLLIGVGFLWTVGGNTTADYAPGADNQYSKQEDAEDILMEDIHMEAIQEAKPETIPETIPETTSPTKPETAPESLSSPPDLYIVTESGESILAMTGTYSWRWTGNDGQTYGVEACSFHPLQSQEYLSLIQTTGSSLQLDFDTATHGVPYHISVQCWSDIYWDKIDMEGRSLTVTDDLISLQEGGTIYQVTAKWSSGTVYYAFYVNYTPEKN